MEVRGDHSFKRPKWSTDCLSRLGWTKKLKDSSLPKVTEQKYVLERSLKIIYKTFLKVHSRYSKTAKIQQGKKN